MKKAGGVSSKSYFMKWYFRLEIKMIWMPKMKMDCWQKGF